MSRRLAAVAFALVAGCSSADFSIAFVPTSDAGARVDAAVDTAVPPPDSDPGVPDAPSIPDAVEPIDTNVGDAGGAPDSGPLPPEGGVACPGVPDPTDIYVDLKSTSAVPNGTSGCPFKTITAALTYIGTLGVKKRIVHVKGGTVGAPYVYVEPGVVKVGSNVYLLGDGPKLVTIEGGGACPSAGQCVVFVEGNGVVDGVTVNAKGPRHAIATGPMSSGVSPQVKSTIATGATGDGNFGVLATSGALLGPFIEVYGNARAGVTIWGSQVVRIVDGINRFDGNGMEGIEVEGGILQFEGGQANGNGTSDIRFAGSSLTFHNVRKLTAKGNKIAGISGNGNTGLTLRDSTLLENTYGLMFTFGASNNLDLGRDGAIGNNTFGTATLATQNKYAGLCLQMIRTGTNVNAEGNKWSTCTTTPPTSLPGSSTQQLYDGCGETFTAYRDIYYRNATGGGASAPVATWNCTVAP